MQHPFANPGSLLNPRTVYLLLHEQTGMMLTEEIECRVVKDDTHDMR